MSANSPPTDKVNRDWLRKLRTAVEDMRNPCFGSELHNQAVRDIENMLLVHVDEILASLSAVRSQVAFCPVSEEGCMEKPVCVWPCKKLKDAATLNNARRDREPEQPAEPERDGTKVDADLDAVGRGSAPLLHRAAGSNPAAALPLVAPNSSERATNLAGSTTIQPVSNVAGTKNNAREAYTPDQQRAANYIVEISGIGGGDDPVGFLIASHAALASRSAIRPTDVSSVYCTSPFAVTVVFNSTKAAMAFLDAVPMDSSEGRDA